MGKHLRRSSVFFDETGRRTRLASVALRSTTVALLGSVAVVVISLVSGVPMPGITPPVQLPRNERPGRHAQPHPSPTGLVAGPAVPAPSSVPATTQAPATQPLIAPTTPATVTPSPTAGRPSTPPGSTRKNKASPSPSASPSTHGHPPATPPGRTKHP